MLIQRATDCSEDVLAELEDIFNYQPWTNDQINAGLQVREALKNAVKLIIEHVPPCPTRSVAIRKLLEARMDCNAAITHGGKY